MSRATTVLLGVLAAGWGALYYLGRTWGSTKAERSRPLPGDELVPVPSTVTDHAIDIEATPEAIWPWLLQVGWHRGGWYTYRWVDALVFPANAASANAILPEYQRLEVGDRIPDGPPESGCYFTVRQLDPNRHMVLTSSTHLPPQLLGRPGIVFEWSWTFHLEPVDARSTRFHFRSRLFVRPWWLRLLYELFIVPADFLMGRSMCHGLKQRAEQHPVR